MQKSFFKIIIATFFPLLLASVTGFAQVTLTGPTCVIAGTEYQYDINRDKSKTATMQFCITGGVIAGTDSTCKNGTAFNFIRVIWDGTPQGKISFSSSRGNASFSVKKTTTLDGGKISGTVAFQSATADSIPASIKCSAASGGGCSPVYKYQWQQSADGINWANLNGAIAQNLPFLSFVTKSTYYRRKVVESVSGSESFSDVIVLVINSIKTVTP
jgi:hypothetical protein